MIIDSHLHIFPFLDGACGFPSRDLHLEYLQYYMVGHGQPVRRRHDHAIIPDGSLQLYDQASEGPSGLADVNFRVERNGRFCWSQGGEERYIHFMPPGLERNEATVDAVLAQMAYIGVDVGVLQNAHLYGRLNEEFATAVRDHPTRFVGLAEVEEFNAHTQAEIDSLRVAAGDGNLRGLYYANRSFLWDGYQHRLDDRQYDEFWATVEQMELTVFWELAAIPQPTVENFLVEANRVAEIHRRYPRIRSVLTHGFLPADVLNPPKPIERLMDLDQLSFEILFPIYWGRNHDYPYLELRPVLRELVRRVGASRLCWGSDLPNVERNCTYRQSIEYIDRIGDFLSPIDRDLILGDNLAELLGLT